ncbi:hypothetical protein BCR42DRAFT_461190 [Absidia repens]|uniref:GDP-fucose protein O-fucosyltransferase-domain-containing protein n=1 Tax=Absidia repens TaxID=90262 RepID=A0A1X2IER1_9FUNG|nr:hypothetical protein BCR42DRAFT_461190 [Absidia repens]
MVADDDTDPIDLDGLTHGQDALLQSPSPISSPSPGTVTSSLIQSINQKYCGAAQCRFLLPIAITEQESKAQYHFRQVAFLSGMAGRTIVLPNVHGSHLGACRHQPFDYYYDHTWLDKNRAHFNYITMAQFKAWLDERHAAKSHPQPTGQEVFIELNDASAHLNKATNCFGHLFNFTDRPRTRFQLEDPEQRTRRAGNFTQIFLDVLTTHTADAVDVLHLFYDRRFGYIEHPHVEQPLGYHARWHAVADKIAAQLSPFISVHWRMERLTPLTHLKPCAEQLVNKLQQQQQQQQQQQHGGGVKNVFLLTDYPHLVTSSMAKPESMSFKLNELRQEHHDAIRYLYQHTNVSLTTTLPQADLPIHELPTHNWNLITVDPLIHPVDKSILGIVDKLLAMRAQWFLYGEPGVCGKESSFTRRIRSERLRAYRLHDPKIVSPGEAFGLS